MRQWELQGCALAIALILHLFITTAVGRDGVHVGYKQHGAGAGNGAGQSQIRRQQILVQNEPQETPITITQVIVVSKPYETDLSQSEMCHAEDNAFHRSLISDTKDVEPEQSVYRWWFLLLIKPLYLAKVAVVFLFLYILRPACLAGLWTLRVLLFKPAVLIYLVFLERPFKTMLSVFLWILPILAFILVVTIVAILIGGIFGWLSAVALGLLNSPVANEPLATPTETKKPSTKINSPRTVQLVLPESSPDGDDQHMLSKLSESQRQQQKQQQQHADVWTRRQYNAPPPSTAYASPKSK